MRILTRTGATTRARILTRTGATTRATAHIAARALACALFILFFATGCFENPENKISYEDYRNQGELMINITAKLSNETDVNRLNSAARGVELARVVACRKLYDECALYGKFLSYAVEVSGDGKLSYDDVQELRARQRELANEIHQGYASFEKK